jgi:hypothetical protein
MKIGLQSKMQKANEMKPLSNFFSYFPSAPDSSSKVVFEDKNEIEFDEGTQKDLCFI